MKIDKYGRITMTRAQIVALMLACTALDKATPKTTERWRMLHDELQNCLKDYDELISSAKEG